MLNIYLDIVKVDSAGAAAFIMAPADFLGWVAVSLSIIYTALKINREFIKKPKRNNESKQ